MQEIKKSLAKDQFKIFSLDLNADSIEDLVISRINDTSGNLNLHQGDELYILIGDKSGKYKLSLSTSNRTDDGGFFLGSIIPRSNMKGFILSTYFSSRGYPFKDYYFMESNNKWKIKEVIVKGYLGEDQFYCHHPQNYIISSSSFTLSENSMSDEDISKECPYPPTKFKVKANNAEILTDNFESRSPPNYYVKGDAIEAFDQNEDWVKVSYKNGTKFGWIDKRDLSPVLD